MKKVLVLCTGNSCRSQMAEALWNQIGAGQWQASSAGSNPAGYVHPLAIEAMGEIGLDIQANQSQHVDEFQDQAFDIVVTVCDNAREACPVFPGAGETLHWPFDDPAYATGSEEDKKHEFARVRDEIATRIREHLDSL